LNPIYTIAYNPHLIREENISNVGSQLQNQIEIDNSHIIIDSVSETYKFNLNLVPAEADIIITPLSTAPLTIDVEWVIAALLDFENYTQGLFIHPQSLDSGADLRLKHGSVIGVIEDIDGMQLKKLNTSIDYLKVDNAKKAFELLKSNKISALFVNTLIEEQNFNQTDENIAFIPINTKEMIPAAGSKAIAILCRKENIVLRKAIQNIHNKEVSQRTNLERKTAQLLSPNETRSYCEADSKGNFHLHIASLRGIDQFRRAKVSQSTTTQLIENTMIALNHS